MSDFETAKADLTAAERAVADGVTHAASTYTAPLLARMQAEEQAASGWLARWWRPIAAACAAAVAVVLVMMWLI